MAAPDFTTSLEQMFTMLTPSDLADGLKLNLGGPQAEITGGAFSTLQSIIENDAKGVLTTADIISKLNDVTTLSGAPTSDDLKKFFDVISTKGAPSWVSDDHTMYMTKDGPKKLSGFNQVVGANFTVDPSIDVLLMCSRSPFFNPATRHARRIEIFLNSMPSVVLQSMVPLLDIEFQVTKAPSAGLPYLSNLRFLAGNVSPDSLGDSDKVMLEGRQLVSSDVELEYAGMEMFTSPQTMVNPTPNVNAAGQGIRYADVLDPFRPFASIESCTISIKGTVGMMQYKKASLTLKLHDRSRLSEISDLIRPESYGNVVLWLTYGWRAPVLPQAPDPAAVPYFDFINNNLLMREAYKIVNSQFSFDQVGQVIVTLELATQGGQQIKTTPITHALAVDGKETSYSVMKKVKELGERIAQYRKRLKLDPPEGINKEIRTYQLLDAAQVGEFPDMKASDVESTISTLSSQLTKKGDPDSEAVKNLITSLKTLYSKDQKTNKFSLQERIKTLATNEVADKFKEVQTGADPYLLDDSKTKEKATSPLAAEIKKYQAPPKGKTDQYVRKIVSFGKLFSTFALTTILPMNICEEVQVFFYGLNNQCGPVSGHSIAEFPIDMEVFIDQYRDHAVRRGGENITLDEFLGLVINAQVLDNRAVGYGLRKYYEPYAPNKDASVDKNKEKDFESALANFSKTNGPFKKPSIAMVMEMSHQKASADGQSDAMTALAYSSKDATPKFSSDVQKSNSHRILRIHIYDSQVHPYLEPAHLLKAADGGPTFIEAPPNDFIDSVAKMGNISTLQANVQVLTGIKLSRDRGVFTLSQDFSNARQVKDVVSKLVPTITYGVNGTTVSNASLSTKAESLLSTVNMLRSNTTKNAAQPNGSGEGGIPLRVIPAQMTMTSLGCPLACINQYYFIDFNTGTTIDNLYGCTALQHVLAAGKFETQWTFAFADAYGVFEGAPNIVDQITKLSADIPKKT